MCSVLIVYTQCYNKHFDSLLIKLKIVLMNLPVFSAQPKHVLLVAREE